MFVSSSTVSFFGCSAIILQLLLSTTNTAVTANDNGLAMTPPLGWRSWNLFGADVNQYLIESIMDGMVKRTRRDHLGQLTSLCDLGYW